MRENHLDVFYQDESLDFGDLFDSAFENLLLWAAQYLYVNPNKEKDMLQNFVSGLGFHPTQITFAPIFRLHRDQQEKIKSLKLSEHVELIEPDFVHRELFKHETRSIAQSSGFPAGLHNTLPDLVLKISVKKGDSDKHRSEVNATIAAFRVLMCGLFNCDVEMPFAFHGISYPWFPFTTTGSQSSKEFPQDASYRNFNDRDMKLLEKYWQLIGLKRLKQYSITATRLQQAKGRTSLMEKVVDLSIALEGLFSEETELSFRYSTIAASLVTNNPQQRFEVYSLFKSFYDLRSKIVHGKSFEKNRDWTNLKNNELLERLRPIEAHIRQLLRYHLLNENLRDGSDKIKIMLGAPNNLINHVSLD